MPFEFDLEQVRARSIRNIIYSQRDNGGASTIPERKINLFFDQLSIALKTEDVTLIAPSLDDWMAINTEIENEFDCLLAFMSIFNGVQQTALKVLSSDRAERLIAALQPYFIYGIQYISQEEMEKSVSEAMQRLNLQQNALIRLEKSKSDFISIAAHELRTPLTLIEGYSAMLREIINQKKIYDDHIIQLIDGMDSGSLRLREIINDMLDVSLIDNDMLSLSYQPVWINKLLERLQNEVKPSTETRRLTLEVHRFNNDDRMFFSDGERIYQALYNVISNAIKFTPDGGKIVIDGNAYDEFIEIIIVDNGVGIDAENQKKIFEKFQPINNSALHTSGKQKFMGGGPGLGLPIAKGIIEAHGGRIWVESDEYNEIECPGSTFHILLPVNHQLPENLPAAFFEPLQEHNSDQEK